MTPTFMLFYGAICVILIGLLNLQFFKKKDLKQVASVNKKINNVEALDEIKPEEEYKVNVGKVLFVLMFGMFTAILNQTTINVALPVMTNDLNVATTTAQWLITGFMLVNGIVIPITAFLIQRFGFRKLFLFSMISFTIGSLICAVSHSFALIMIGRIVQAIGAGILMPLGMNIFMTMFPPEKRGAAMGLFGIAMILAPAIGPTLSGYIVQNYHWNVIFYGMFIIGLIDTLFAFGWFKLNDKTTRPSVDILGMVYSTIGFGSLLYGFSEAGSKGWGDGIVISTIIIGIVFTTVFTVKQITEENPLLEFDVFKYRDFSFTLIINAINTMALFGGMLLLPIYLQNIRGFTPIESGLLMLPGALIMGLMGPIAGKFFDKYGIRVLAVVGLTITTYGSWEFTHLTMDTPYSHILSIYILRSFGMSLLMMPIMTAGMNALPLNLIPHGTAMSNTIRQIAGSIGTAFLVTIMTNQTTAHLADKLSDMSTNNLFFVDKLRQLGQQVANAAHIPTTMGNQLATQQLYGVVIKQSTINGINDAFLIATLISMVALILSFFLHSSKAKKENE